MGGLCDVEFHKDKESAIKFYLREARYYFREIRMPKKIDVPNACGFPHRQFMVMSIRKFKELYPKYKGVSKCDPKK
jgi:hypothetical protein